MKAIKTYIQKNPSLQDLYQNIQNDLNKVEDKLQLFAQSSNPLITDISEYLFKRAGKRIRPALLILCSKMFGYQGQEHILMSTLVETIHTASLLHDDIIDNSETRRGRETVHTRWGPNITVLLGDYLYINSINQSLDSQHREFIQILTAVSSQMIEGELQEYYMSGNLDLTEKDYLEIINSKTASLFSAACRIGTILGEASPEEITTMAEYGTCLGISFQIIDDLLDYSGDKKTLGKPVLSDLSEGRITLPLIYTLNHDGKENRARLHQLFAHIKSEPNLKNEILEIVRANGALDYTYNLAEEYAKKAQRILDTLPDSVFREALQLLPEYVLYRNK